MISTAKIQNLAETMHLSSVDIELLKLASKQLAGHNQTDVPSAFDKKIAYHFVCAYINPENLVRHTEAALDLFSQNYSKLYYEEDYTLDAYDLAFLATLTYHAVNQAQDWLPNNMTLRAIILLANGNPSFLFAPDEEEEKQTQGIWIKESRFKALQAIDTILENLLVFHPNRADNWLLQASNLGLLTTINRAGRSELKTLAFSILISLFQLRPSFVKEIAALGTSFLGHRMTNPSHLAHSCLKEYHTQVSQMHYPSQIKDEAKRHLEPLSNNSLSNLFSLFRRREVRQAWLEDETNQMEAQTQAAPN